MNLQQIVLSLNVTINTLFDLIAKIVFWAGLAFMLVRFTGKSMKKDGFGKGLYMGVVATIETSLLVLIIYFLPQSLVQLFQDKWELAIIRWIFIYLIAIGWSYRASYKASGWRGILFILMILIILSFGWLYDRWLGIFAMSVPVLLICFYFIHRLAQVILPTSDPEAKVEVWKKTRVFLVYLLGVQHPFWMAKASTGRELEDRIKGAATNEIGKPGIIWTWSHQVVGISKGVGFTRVAGPGLIFTDPFESPLKLVDLRKQSRISKVNAVTKDGIEVKTVVSTVFAVDKEAPLAPQSTERRRSNYEGSFEIDHPDGSYPYSSGRVRTVLSTTGIVNISADGDEKHESYWDDWVLMQVEHVIHLVVAERSLDEMWRPKEDGLGISALDEIANRLKGLLAANLKEVGINLLSVRIVNYELDKENKIVLQNRTTWRSYWEQRIAEANADIEMTYREEIEKAHAYSKSILLSAIADSINKARSINDALPRHMIAQYFIHALEEYIKGQPGLNVSESKKHLEMVKGILMSDRLEGSE